MRLTRDKEREYRLSLHEIHTSLQRTVNLETDLHTRLQLNETVLN